MKRLVSVCCLAAAVLLGACRAEFDPKLYPNSEDLFAQGMKQYNGKHWDNAIAAFEKLTRDLPARDPMLPLAYFYLGRAQERNGDHLLAAQSFTRISEAFPEDTLADDAVLAGGLAYAAMWRKPQLDPQYGERALSTLRSMGELYPESPLLPRAKQEIARLDNMMAEKDFGTGYHYFKRGAYDSAIIYFKDVVRLHPGAPAAREAYLRLYDAYRARKYAEDARDACDAMRKAYPNDREVRARCGSASSAAASTPRT